MTGQWTKSTEKLLRLVATEVGAYTENGVLSCGALGSGSEGADHYVNIQATVDGPDEEGWGVYFEIDDQVNSGYERLRRVCLNGSELVLFLNEGARWYPALEQIVVDLHGIPEQEVSDLVAAIGTCIEKSGLVVERAGS